MNLYQRFAYFGTGLFVGVLFLIFFLSGKKASCDYSPNARVLKNIRIKKRKFTPLSQQQLKQLKLDTAWVSQLLVKGDVDFSKSQTDLDSCKVYTISYQIPTGSEVHAVFENCDTYAQLLKISSN